MFAPPICRRRWRNNALPFRQLDEDGGNLANIAASGASNQNTAPRIARRCPGRTNEQTRISSVSERGRQRPQSAIRASGASNQTLREQPHKNRHESPNSCQR